MAQNLLLEIGTEEIPAKYMPGALAQLAEVAKAKFAERRIACGEIVDAKSIAVFFKARLQGLL